MKEVIKYIKTYARDETHQKIHSDYNEFIERINSEAILINEKHPETYLSIGEKCLTKIEISYERIDDETPYSVTVNLEKQGQLLKTCIESILLSEGFKKIIEPIVH